MILQEQACSTFNFLNSEHRVVAAALIPPQQLDLPMADEYILHDEHTPIPSDNENLDDHPQITRTMESFKKQGFLNTVAENERKKRSLSFGPFANRGKDGKESEEKEENKGDDHTNKHTDTSEKK